MTSTMVSTQDPYQPQPDFRMQGHYRRAADRASTVGEGRDSLATNSPDRSRSDHRLTSLEGKARTLGSRMSSSARRSRKSSLSNREILRVLFEEKAAVDNAGHDLEDAYERIKRERQRVSEAERVAFETNERLRGMNNARIAAQQEAARLQTELRLYKLQWSNAQRQLQEANNIIAESDAERERAEIAAAKFKRALEKQREAELARRAREEGRREAREEMMRDAIREKERLAFEMERMRLEGGSLGDDGVVDDRDDDDIREVTARHPVADVSNTVPIVKVPDPENARTLSPIVDFPQAQQTLEYPQAPEIDHGGPVIPLEMPSQENPSPTFPQNFTVEQTIPIVPDHIIVRSPAQPATSPFGLPPPPVPVPVAQPDPQLREYGTPKSSSSHSGIYHSRHRSVPEMYVPQSSSSSSSSSASTVSPDIRPRPLSRSSGRRTPAINLDYAGVPPPLSARTPDLYHQREVTHGVPAQPENIVPLPPYGPPAYGRSNTPGPNSRNLYYRPHVNSVSSSESTTDEEDGRRTPRARPSSRASAARPSLNHSNQSSESSSVPGITIEPPSRPESIGSVVTSTTLADFGGHGRGSRHHHPHHHSAHGYSDVTHTANIQASPFPAVTPPFINTFGSAAGAASVASPLSTITIDNDTLPRGFFPTSAIPEGGQIPRPPTAPPNFVPTGIVVDPSSPLPQLTPLFTNGRQTPGLPALVLTSPSGSSVMSSSDRGYSGGSGVPVGTTQRPSSRASSTTTLRRAPAPGNGAPRPGSASPSDFYAHATPSSRTPRPSPLRTVNFGVSSRPSSRASHAITNFPEHQYMIDVDEDATPAVPLLPGDSGAYASPRPTFLSTRPPVLSGDSPARTDTNIRRTPHRNGGALPSFYE